MKSVGGGGPPANPSMGPFMGPSMLNVDFLNLASVKPLE